jgi:hypothetical protein
VVFLIGQLGLKEAPSLKSYFDLGGQRKRHVAPGQSGEEVRDKSMKC